MDRVEVFLAADGTVDIYIHGQPTVNLTVDEARTLASALIAGADIIVEEQQGPK